MTAELIQWPGPAVCTPVGHVIRTGDWAHRRLEDLHAEGGLPARAVIVDGSVADGQAAFVRALRDSGADVILDTKVAELSAVGKCRGASMRAPWSGGGKPLEAADFKPGANAALFSGIARCAVRLGVSAVLAPSHFLREGASDPWLTIDLESVEALREALDREGGHAIAVDYALIVPRARLPDADEGAGGFEVLRGLPVENLFLRLSGFGADSGPFTVQRAFQGIVRLHELGMPSRARLRRWAGGSGGVGAWGGRRDCARDRRARAVCCAGLGRRATAPETGEALRKGGAAAGSGPRQVVSPR